MDHTVQSLSIFAGSGFHDVDPLVVCYAFLRSIAQIGGVPWLT